MTLRIFFETGVVIVLIGMATAGSSFYSLMPFVLSEIVTYENVNAALGVQTVFQSVGTVASTFISGRFTCFDSSKNSK